MKFAKSVTVTDSKVPKPALPLVRITEDEADLIISNRRMKGPRCTLEDVIREFEADKAKSKAK